MREHPAQCERTHKTAFWILQHACVLDIRATVFKHFAVAHASRTNRFTRQTAKSKIKLLAERPRDFEISLRDGTHECDATARAVALQFRLVVSRASRQTHPAMDALLEHGKIEVLEIL